MAYLQHIPEDILGYLQLQKMYAKIVLPILACCEYVPVSTHVGQWVSRGQFGNIKKRALKSYFFFFQIHLFFLTFCSLFGFTSSPTIHSPLSN